MTRPLRMVTSADGERLTEADVLSDEERAEDAERERAEGRRTRRWQSRVEYAGDPWAEGPER